MPTRATTRRPLRRRAGTSARRTTPTTRRACLARPTARRRATRRRRRCMARPRRCTASRRTTSRSRSNQKSGSDPDFGLAQLDRSEDALVAALHEEREGTLRLRRSRAQLLGALDPLAVYGDHDVAALDAGARRGAGGLLDHQAPLGFTQGEAELARVLASLRSGFGARDLLGLELADGHRDRALRTVAPHLEIGLRSGLHGRHERAPRLVEAERLRERLRHFLDRHADAAALHLAVLDELLLHLRRDVDRDREADALVTAAAREDLRVDADHFAPRIE